MGGGFAFFLVMVAGLIFGVNPLQLLPVASGVSRAVESGGGPAPDPDDPTVEFMEVMLGMTEDVWGRLFAEAGTTYRPPTLAFYTDMVTSACGRNSAATGPFYCPPDQTIYLDVGFFDELSRMGGPGDFAQAYVLGHEVGHHIQTLLGTSQEVRRLQQGRRQAEVNQLSVLLELQADCYAGVWAHHANEMRPGLLETGDIQEGLRAAAAIGDDRLLRQAGRATSPESFTHGSSEQRARGLAQGLQSGDVSGCDTFGAAGM
jgi:predicted metalloprotease